jgi:FAD/FMN-containing dehydrogenase
MTEAKLGLVKEQKHSGLLVLFLRDMKGLGELIPAVLRHKPTTFESFDDQTLFLSLRHLPSFLKMLGFRRYLAMLVNLIPDVRQLLRGVPRLILMVEFTGDSEGEVRQKIHNLHAELGKTRARYEINGFDEAPTPGKSERFWVMRRNSFQILRSKAKDKHTAPYIDDFIVPPANLTSFLPQLRQIIKKYKLFATIAGHMGDGNFHVIPLMQMEKQSDRDKLRPSMDEVNKLVLDHGGSISGEHNDGMVRGPWLEAQYGSEIVDLFREIKDIYDPENIFNPHKKTDATWGFSFAHIRTNFRPTDLM